MKNVPMMIPAAAAAMGLLLFGGGCTDQATEEALPEPARNVRTLELAGESITEYFEISGPVAPVSGTWLSAEESGPVVAIPVDKGEAVKKGGIVLEQERTILRAERDAARATLKMQEYNVDKVRQLYEAGKVSRIELLTAESAWSQAKSAADVASKRYERAGVSAPFEGVVSDRSVELGEMVAPGQRVARVIDPYTLKLEAYLTDSQVQWIAEGDPATVILGENRTPVGGTVSWVAFEADRMTGKFQVEIEIPNPELRYHSGVIGRARLRKSQEAGVVVIPRDAVLAGRIGPTAFVVEDGRAVLRQLRLGSDQGLMVIVRDGLGPGDALVVRGQRDLREGVRVKVTEVATAPDGSLPTDPADLTRGTAGPRIEAGAADAGVEGGR
jgi:RND family efflux transporter MFP subunit